MDRRLLVGSSVQQRLMRVVGVLLACMALVNVLAIAKAMGVLTTSDVLLVGHRDEQPRLQRLRNDDELIVTESKWAELVAAADAAHDQEPPVMKIHYTAKQRAPFTEKQWQVMNGPDVEIHYYDDDACAALVRERRPQFLKTYWKLSPVERADYFRYLVLWAYGGVYVDSDISFLAPVGSWLSAFGWDARPNGRKRQLQSLDAVIGVEFPSPQTHYNNTGWLPLQFTQFVIVGTKGSELLKNVVLHIEDCVDKIARGDDVEATIERTGPAAFTRAILDYIISGGVVAPSVAKMHKSPKSDPRYPRALLPVEELEKSGQLIRWRRPRTWRSTAEEIRSVLVLPYRAFAYHPFHGQEPVLTRHFFANSWRNSN